MRLKSNALSYAYGIIFGESKLNQTNVTLIELKNITTAHKKFRGFVFYKLDP